MSEVGMKRRLSISKLQRVVQVRKAYDCIETQPCIFTGEVKCGHGRHSAEVLFSLVAEDIAVTLAIASGWWPDATPDSVNSLGPTTMGLFYHFPAPPTWLADYDPRDCDLLSTERCWGDWSGMRADTPWRLLREEGDEAMWSWLARDLEGMRADVKEHS